MVSTWTRNLTMGGFIAALFGCSHPTALLEAPLDDAIAYVQLADPMSAFAESELGIPLSPERLRGRERCPFEARSLRFECPTYDAGTLQYSRSYQLISPDGSPTSDWGAGVAEIRFVSDVSGSVFTAQGTITVSRHDDATLGDLRDLRQTLTGNATLTWSDGQSSWTARRSTQLQVMSRARTSGTFPVGSIQLEAHRAAAAHARSALLSFDGTPTASVLLSFDGSSTLSCRIDLQSADGASTCR